MEFRFFCWMTIFMESRIMCFIIMWDLQFIYMHEILIFTLIENRREIASIMGDGVVESLQNDQCFVLSGSKLFISEY